MLDWKEQWIDGEKFPFTPSVVDVHGVEAACDELLEEGLEASIERHEGSARRAAEGVRAMGLELWPRTDALAAACVTAIAVPDGLTDVSGEAHCRQRYGVMISAGQGAGNLVRIGHMGPSARLAPPGGRSRRYRQTLRDLGAPVDIGSASRRRSPSSHRRVRPSSSHDLRLAHARRLVRVDVRRLARPATAW